MKIFEFRFKKKKGKKKSRKDNFPSFFTASWTAYLYPETPCTRRNSAYVTRSNNVSNTSKRKRWSDRGRTSEVHNWEDRVSEEREGKRERERAQRLPPIDFCALAVNSRVLLLYATPSPPLSYLASVIDYLIPIDRDPVHPITDHLPPPCPTLILDRFCTASINRREIDIPIPPPL